MSGDPHCKIGKVTLRGGAELRVFDNRSPHIQPEIRRRFMKNAGEIHSQMPDMAGYVLVGWARDGTYLRATQVGNGTTVRESQLPSFIADILRRDWWTPNDTC